MSSTLQNSLPPPSRSALSLRGRHCLCAIAVLYTGIAASAQAPALPEGTARSWAQAASNNELSIIDAEGNFPVRYRVRKVDAKGDITREVIEAKQGSVARLVERNGQPITADEDAGERERLTEALNSPQDFLRHHRRDSEIRDYSKQLVRLLPTAMLYSYVAGQPQPKGSSSPQVVLAFTPDPAFRPPMMIANLLTGIEGRVWIDAQTRRMTRVEAHVLRPVNFGLGVLAHIYPGGTVEFEQAQVGADRWVYAHVEEHLTIRELMLKTAPQNTVMTSWDFRMLPSPVDYQDAIRTLLAMPLPLH